MANESTTDEPKKEELTKKEWYDVHKGQVTHEDLLFNQRVTWMIALQAFLVFPYLFRLHYEEGIVATAKPTYFISLFANLNPQPNDVFCVNNFPVSLVIASAGLVGCILAMCSAIAAILAIEFKHRLYSQQSDDCVAPLRSIWMIHTLGLLGPFGLAFLFAGMWITLIQMHGYGAGNFVTSVAVLLFGILCIVCVAIFVEMLHQVRSAAPRTLHQVTSGANDTPQSP